MSRNRSSPWDPALSTYMSRQFSIRARKPYSDLLTGLSSVLGPKEKSLACGATHVPWSTLFLGRFLDEVMKRKEAENEQLKLYKDVSCQCVLWLRLPKAQVLATSPWHIIE